jgi:hypothetical protein
MSYSSSLTSYPDITAALDKALASPKGVRIVFESKEAVSTFCGRVHSFRFKDRIMNMKIYGPEHKMHGNSAYDPLMIRKNGLTVEIIKLDGVEFKIEDIT